jgi:hypothetical protein
VYQLEEVAARVLEAAWVLGQDHRIPADQLRWDYLLRVAVLSSPVVLSLRAAQLSPVVPS